jgi:hypothetical protein
MQTALLRAILIPALGLSLSSRAAPPEQALAAPASETSFARALDLIRQARAGEKSAVEPAIAAFDALVRGAPQQPVYAAHLGSAFALKGRDAWMPWNKVRYVEQGTDRIDAALAALKPEHERQLLRGVPVSVETRFVAASTFIKIPDAIFHRRAEGKRLLAGILGSSALSSATPGFGAAVHLAAADLARDEERRQDEARELGQALALAGSGTAAERARARLRELGQ